jgi:hypothetical protein
VLLLIQGCVKQLTTNTEYCSFYLPLCYAFTYLSSILYREVFEHDIGVLSHCLFSNYSCQPFNWLPSLVSFVCFLGFPLLIYQRLDFVLVSSPDLGRCPAGIRVAASFSRGEGWWSEFTSLLIRFYLFIFCL